jgi:hypothetical protein
MTLGTSKRVAAMGAVVCALALGGARARGQAGPPFQTDDPTPVELGHYEAYVFGQADGTPVEMDAVGPAFEFNWGAVPNIQLHAIVPLGGVWPSNNPAYLPGGVGASAFGVTDAELGFKWGFIKQTKHRPQIGSFTMFEIPTGSYAKGLGVGKVWYKLPLWAEKEFGAWSLCGGMGYTVVPQVGYRNFLYGGVLLKRVVNERLELSAEVFSHAREGRRRRRRRRRLWWMRVGITTSRRRGGSCCLLMGTRWRGRRRIMGIWGCIRRGGRIAGRQRRGNNRMRPLDAGDGMRAGAQITLDDKAHEALDARRLFQSFLYSTSMSQNTGAALSAVATMRNR